MSDPCRKLEIRVHILIISNTKIYIITYISYNENIHLILIFKMMAISIHFYIYIHRNIAEKKVPNYKC